MHQKSRLMTPITHIVTLLISLINPLTKSPDPASRVLEERTSKLAQQHPGGSSRGKVDNSTFQMSSIFTWGYYGTQYRVKFDPPSGYSILNKEYNLTGINHQKTLLRSSRAICSPKSQQDPDRTIIL